MLPDTEVMPLLSNSDEGQDGCRKNFPNGHAQTSVEGGRDQGSSLCYPPPLKQNQYAPAEGHLEASGRRQGVLLIAEPVTFCLFFRAFPYTETERGSFISQTKPSKQFRN